MKSRNWNINRAGTFPFVITLLLLISLTVIAILSTVSFKGNADLVSHTYQVIGTLDEIESLIIDLETGQRGYIITGNPNFLEPYNAGLPQIAKKADYLTTLTADNWRQEFRIIILKELLQNKLRLTNEGIASRSTSGFETAATLVGSGEGKKIMDQIRLIIQEMKTEENNLLAARSASVNTNSIVTPVLVLSGSVIAVATIFMAMIAVSRQLELRRRSEKTLQLAEARLKDITDTVTAQITYVSNERQFTFVNKQFESWLQKPAWEIYNHPVSEIMGSKIYSGIKSYVDKALSGIGVSFEQIRTSPKGATQYFTVTYTPHINEKQEVLGFYSLAQDISELKQKEEALRRSEELYRTLGHNYPNGGIILLDKEFRHILVDGKGLSKLGIDKNQLEGRTLYEYFPDDLIKLYEPFYKSLFKGVEALFEVPIGELTYIAQCLPIINENSEVEIGLVILRDITEERAAAQQILWLNQSLERRAKELEVMNSELESFSYSVSHDLRAPLRSIDGFSLALLEDYSEKLDDTGKNYLNRVRRATQKMSQLIDDMLLLSRVSRADLKKERIDLSAIARDLMHQLKEENTGREVEFILQEGLFAQGDSRLLQVVLDNLFRNAWKFTSKKPQARIEFGTRPYKSKTAYFVKDDGVGFDMEYAHKLFGAFQRLHTSTEFPGTGVGLAIVQRIIHRHNGEIWAESKQGEGAAFYFTLPGNN